MPGLSHQHPIPPGEDRRIEVTEMYPFCLDGLSCAPAAQGNECPLLTRKAQYRISPAHHCCPEGTIQSGVSPQRQRYFPRCSNPNFRPRRLI